MKSITNSVFLLAFLVCSCRGQQTAAVGNPLTQPGQIATPSLFPSVPSPDLATPDIGSSEMQSTTPAKSTLAADKHEQRVRRLWYGSTAMMLAGNAADAMTSWQKQEANGLLASTNGTFGGKAIGIKVAISAAILTPQLLLRHHPELRKEFIIGNLIDAALFGGTAIHNAGISKP